MGQESQAVHWYHRRFVFYHPTNEGLEGLRLPKVGQDFSCTSHGEIKKHRH